MPLKGVVLAGGSGSRLFPLTLVTNKHLLPVYDRPMIFYPLQTLKEMGCREVLVVVGGRSVGDILELLHDGSEFGLSLTYRYQRGALGIAHAIGLAREFAEGDPIAIVLGRQHPERLPERVRRTVPGGAVSGRCRAQGGSRPTPLRRRGARP